MSININRIVLTISSIVLLAGAAYFGYVIYLNSPYTGSVNICDKAIDQCQGYEAYIYWDSMDGIYTIEKVYMPSGELLFPECIVRAEEKNECKDVNNKEWAIQVMEPRGLF